MEAKKPRLEINRGIKPCGGGSFAVVRVERYFCPVCENLIRKSQEICKCGQKLDWSEE